MRIFITAIISLVIVLNTSFAQNIPSDSLYLGQTPPGSTPQKFNLKTTSGLGAAERISISSNNMEIYFSELDGWPINISKIKCCRYLNNKWQDPSVIFEGFVAPSLSMNDSILFMQNSSATTYYSERTGSGWSVPKKLLSTNLITHYYQETNLKNYFTSSILPNSPGGSSDICKVQILNNETSLVSLGLPINTSSIENDFYIARNESYNIICRLGGNASDLYISYKNNQGKWTNPKTLGSLINTSGATWDCSPFVTQDNKYLFYSKGSGSSMSNYFIYWVAIDNLIDSLKLTNYIPYVKNAIPNQTDTLNRTFNYTVPDSTFIDDDGNNTLTCSAKLSNGNPLPAWLNFNPATRTLSGTLEQVGTYSIKVTATDTVQASVSSTFNLKVVDNVSISDKKSYQQLLQAYPNPFNPSTAIKFSTREDAQVRLSVYNLKGELVTDLVNQKLTAGLHSYNFNAQNLSSGVYLYKLQIGNQSLIKSMLLLK